MDQTNHTSRLRVLVSGGGPVGLYFALTLRYLLKEKVYIKVYDQRWAKNKKTGAVEWKSDDDDTERNRRREQVVTIQSTQYLNFPSHLQALFVDDANTSLMWPLTQEEKSYPRNIRISDLEDHLLSLANSESEGISLIPSRFIVKSKVDLIKSHHILVICEGANSATRKHFEGQFGAQANNIFSLDGLQPLQDLVLGLKVKTTLSSAAVVALTISQNRFLLNMRNGEGYLNMRLTDDEAKEVKGHKGDSLSEVPCLQGNPCVMIREGPGDDYRCRTHDAVFFPARDEHSKLMPRIREGLRLFGVKEDGLEKITMWRLSMSSACRFTAELYPGSNVVGALLGDAANAIHFWPGRGLNSGLASALSLARCLEARMLSARGGNLPRFREADFIEHEGIMAKLQYRNKTRAWKAMVRVDEKGGSQAIKDKISLSMIEKESGVEALLDRCGSLHAVVGNENMRNQKEISELPGKSAIVQFASRLKPHLSDNEKASRTLDNELKGVSDNLVILEEKIYGEAMRRRVKGIASNLIGVNEGHETRPRMPQDREELTKVCGELVDRLNAVNSDTLRALYFSEPWNTTAMAGPEVDVESIFPDLKAADLERNMREAQEREAEKRQREEVKRVKDKGDKSLKQREGELLTEMGSAKQVHKEELDNLRNELSAKERTNVNWKRFAAWLGVAIVLLMGLYLTKTS